MLAPAFPTMFLKGFFFRVVQKQICVVNGYREYVYSVTVYRKYLTRLGEFIFFEPWRENYHLSQPS